jgi:hypothetical protein
VLAAALGGQTLSASRAMTDVGGEVSEPAREFRPTSGLGTYSWKLVPKLVPDSAEMTPAQRSHWQRIWLI